MGSYDGTADVSVVVTHYRSPQDLARCLRSIAVAGGPRIADVQVADSAALPRHAAVVAEALPGANYLPFDANVGFAALVNAGAAASDAPYVLVLNADITLERHAVDLLAAHLDSHRDVGAAFPRLSDPDGTLQHSTFRFYKPSTVVYRRTPLGRSRPGRAELRRFLAADELRRSVLSGQPLDVDWALGAAMLLRRSALTTTGPFDTGYFMYFEDVDWCLRAWRAGWRCQFVPTAGCRHDYARASATGGLRGLVTNPLLRRHLRAGVRFFARHGIRVSRPAAQAGGVLLDVRDAVAAPPVPRGAHAQQPAAPVAGPALGSLR